MIHVIAAAIANSQESNEKPRTLEEDLKDFAITGLLLIALFCIAAGAAFLFTVGVEWFDKFTMTHNSAFDLNTLTQSIKELFK